MAYSTNIVYLSKAQYQELIANQTITVNGTTVTYNENDIYVTPQVEPITDVKINGTSIGNNGVANIPIAGQNLGVVKTYVNGNGFYGTEIDNNGLLKISCAHPAEIKGGSGEYKPIVPSYQHYSVFYGLAKIAGDTTQPELSYTTAGTYTDTAKQKIQNMLGITDLISTEESSTATAAHAINSTFMMGGKLHRATAAITVGDAVEVGTNCEVVKTDEVFVKNTDYACNATSETQRAGIIGKTPLWSGIQILGNGELHLRVPNDTLIKTGADTSRAIIVGVQHKAVFYGLSKVAGVDLANETVTLGTYPETSKTAIRSLIGAAAASDIPNVPVQDVQIDGASILLNGIANIPIADSYTSGLIKIGSGLSINNGQARINAADIFQIKSGASSFYPVVPTTQHQSVFYGLSKLAGVDLANGSDTIGVYPENAKSAIRTMLGATSPDVIAVQDEQPTSTDTKVWLPETQATGVQVPTMEDMENYVQKTDYATYADFGIVRLQQYGGLQYDSTTRSIKIDQASSPLIKTGTDGLRPITSAKQHESVFYGLAKAAGDTTQSASASAVGAYTDDAKSAIQKMLGINTLFAAEETSTATAAHVANSLFTMNGKIYRATSAIAISDAVVEGTNCEAVRADEVFVKNTDIATESQPGIVKVGGSGLNIINGKLYVTSATTAEIQVGQSGLKPIIASSQHIAAFYGLAKAAGDTTQSVSSNAVGTYTTEAKAAIHTMLGIDPASIAAQVDIPLVETVSGTTPSITGQPNVRYVCGEVSTISITPPASGSVDVIFESGSTAAVLTVPNTVKWPAWFDATTLETDTTYEVLITDGVYGSVMTWAT